MTPIQTIIAETLGSHPRRWSVDLCADSFLIADLGCDSLDRQAIACALDEAFGIAIPDDDLARWERVADIEGTVARLVSQRCEGVRL